MSTGIVTSARRGVNRGAAFGVDRRRRDPDPADDAERVVLQSLPKDIDVVELYFPALPP